jgi:hypothetical protein
MDNHQNITSMHMETFEDIIENRVDLLLAIPKWLFNVTLGFSTVLFLLGLIAINNESLLLLAFYIVVIAIVFNILTFFGMIVFSFIYSNYQRSLLLSSFILLANIPIAMLYMIIIETFASNGPY